MGVIYLGEEVPRDNSIFLRQPRGLSSVLIVAFGVLIWPALLGCVAQRQKTRGIALNGVRKQYQMLLVTAFRT